MLQALQDPSRGNVSAGFTCIAESFQDQRAEYLTMHKDTRPALVLGDLSCPGCPLVVAALHDQPVIQAWLGRPVRLLPIPWSHLQSSWQLICWHVHGACMPC